MDSEEYNRLMKEMEEKEKAEVESAPPKQVLATVRGFDEDSDSEKTPPNAAVPGRPIKEVTLDLVKVYQWRSSPG
jgi:hypothetical protein